MSLAYVKKVRINFTLHVWMNHFIATAALVATKIQITVFLFYSQAKGTINERSRKIHEGSAR